MTRLSVYLQVQGQPAERMGWVDHGRADLPELLRAFADYVAAGGDNRKHPDSMLSFENPAQEPDPPT